MKNANEAGPTPGPWSCGWVGNVGTPGLGAPCVGTSGACDWVGPIGADADARLIAAAPDLLAACEKFVRVGGWAPPSGGEWSALVDAARSAIAKARGAS